MAHAYLIPVAELPQYIPGSFLEQFRVRPVEVKISTAGALGIMAFVWRPLGEANYSAPITSSPLSSWTYDLEGAFAIIIFGVGTYVLNSVYTIDEQGAVTRTGGAIDTVTSTRYDLREKKGQAATDMCLGWMEPAVRPPLTSWGADVKEHYAAVLHYLLKSHVGMAPTEAAVGDANLRLRFEDAREWFQRIGKDRGEAQDLVDSSTDLRVGDTLLLPVSSAEPVGWI